MKHLSMRLCVLLAVWGITAVAMAMPKIDPALRPYLSSSGALDQEITVIALFRDKNPLPRLEHNQSGRTEQEMALRENARASQMATYQSLNTLGESGAVRFTSLWLFNAAIIHLPANHLKDLASNNDIIELYANHKVHLLAPVSEAPADPASEGKYTYGLSKIELPALRAKVPNLIGTGVRVGILDTGVDATHPDLAGKVALFKDFINGKSEPYDDNDHGTHVAGTIAGGNASGTTIGIAPGVKIISGKVFSAEGSATDEDLLSAMQWIADPDGNPQTADQPNLVSNSWGGGTPDSSRDPMDEPLCKAVAGWVKLGILPVFAAGNDGPGEGSVGIPGGCPQALAVGATDKDDQLADFSSRGPAVWSSGSFVKPTVSAPGVNVISSVPGGKYKSFSGTSMATPHVAGLAALVYQAMPNATIEQVEKLIVAGAKAMGANIPNNDFGAGRIDALVTIQKASVMIHGGNPFEGRPTYPPQLFVNF